MSVAALCPPDLEEMLCQLANSTRATNPSPYLVNCWPPLVIIVPYLERPKAAHSTVLPAVESHSKNPYSSQNKTRRRKAA